MNFWDAIIQGIVQGLTECLPVSSSGHVSLVQHFTGKNIEGAQTFTLFLHFGTLIAVFIVYRKLIGELILEFFSMVKDLWHDFVALLKNGKRGFEKKFSWQLTSMNENRRMIIFLFIACACAILLFLPIFGIFGLYDSSGELVKTISDISEYTSEDADIIVEGVCLLVTGALLLYATYIARKRKGTSLENTSMTMKSSVAMGLGQCLAAMPGLSRSGTTTTLGMITGTEKNKALQFSFILGIPTILAANVLELVKMDSAERASIDVGIVLLGVVVSAVFGILAIAALKWIVSNDKLHYFGIYCLIVGTIVIAIAIAERAMDVDGIGFIRELFGKNDAVIASSSDITSIADVVSSDMVIN
ncbi:MAG: undecaprenyl-diphosphate phosphatase [Clostridia bacterium]|nr:undecaprenyl-diphosphate phosphatase [Clostridia bacterium]